MFILPRIKKDKNVPLYMSLYTELKENIITHVLEPDEKLPSKRSLASSLGISIKTVENTYEQLMAEGYIRSVEKKGYFVENLTRYREKTFEPPKADVTRFAQTYYKVNLRANRNDPKDFPSNVWAHLIRQILMNDSDTLFQVIPFNGVYELRRNIAIYLNATRGMKVSSDQIIIGAGTEYLYSRLNQLLGSDCIYGLPEPSSKRLRELYEANHLKYRLISSDNTGPDIDQLHESSCHVVHVSPAHQYPLGCPMLMPERTRLLNWAYARPERYIIEDDYDSEYVLTGKPLPPLYSTDVQNKVIYINTFSKSIGPAVRISYMVLPPQLIEKYLKTMSFYSCSVSGLEQYTLSRFIENRNLERYIRRANKKNSQIKAEFLNALKPLLDSEKAQIISGNAGAHFLLKVNTKRSDSELKTMLRIYSIIVSMLTEYYHRPLPEHEHVLVLNYSGITSEQISYFVKTLTEVL